MRNLFIIDFPFQQDANDKPAKHTKHLDHGPHLFPSERARFTHLYYRIWILAVASPEERADRLAKTDLREHFCLFDLLRWACTMLNPEDYDYVGMHPGLRDGSLLNEQQEYMQALHRQHLKLDDTWTYTPGPPLPDDRVLDCWAVFDHCQSVLDGVPGSLTPIEGPSPQCQQAIKSVADQEPSAAEDAKSALAPK